MDQANLASAWAMLFFVPSPPMKNNLILSMVTLGATFVLPLNAATYYISTSGSSAGTGTLSNPWNSVSKISTASLKPGDSVLLKRGDTFYGKFSLPNSGTSSARITIGAYGTGAAPVVTGFKEITGWSSLGNNIWESTSAVTSGSEINMLTVNGVNTPMGRWPNTGRLNVDSYSGKTTITSSSLSGSNWTGAELVLFDQAFTLIRRKITAQSGSTITYSGYTTPSNNKGFFIQNSPKTLDAQNEWYFNPSTKKLRMYSSSMPANVKVATIENLVSLSNRSYITIQDIAFTGANNFGISISSANYINIDNCTIMFAGVDGIRSQYAVSTGVKIQNCSISQCNTGGINFPNTQDGTSGPKNAIIGYNEISDIGMLPGMTSTSGTENIIGIITKGPGHIVEYNALNRIGYVGINFFGNNIIVRNNIINNFDQIAQDGGGIYTWNSGSSDPMIVTTGTKVLNNIVMNGGTSATRDQRDGIYLDNHSNGIEIAGNTVFNVGNGIFLNYGAKNVNVHDNLVYNAIRALMVNGVKNSSTTTNCNIQNNIFVAELEQEASMVIYPNNAIPSTMVFDYNCYARPMDDTTTIQTSFSGSSKITLASWQSKFQKDLHSRKSPKSITSHADLRFEYNDSSSSKTVSFLGLSYVDMKNVTHSDSITLQPFTSTILLRTSGTITSIVAPKFSTQPVSKAVTAGQTATFTASAVGSPNPTYQWKKNGINISGATSTSYTTPATTIADDGAVFTVVASNSGGNANSLTATLTVNPATVAPTITTQPVSKSITAGQTCTFSVVATGTPNPTFQWKKNGTVISGATQSTYTTPVTTLSDNGALFTVVVSNSAGNLTSSAATLTVNAANVAPTITTQPASKTVTAGQTATFSVVATGTPAPTYQWKKNGVEIAGATLSTYTTSATTTADSNSQYTVVVSNLAGSVTSSAASLTVNPIVSSQKVVSFTLINADTDSDIKTLNSGDVLNLATLPTKNINIRANTDPASVGSVIFNLSGAETKTQTESILAYCLYGNTGNDYNPWTPAVGSYLVKATPYSEGHGVGIAGTALSINFTVINQPPVIAPVITSALTANGTTGSTFSYQIVAANNPTSFSASNLPSGLSVNTTTGLISGTSAQTGTFNILMAASNSGGAGNATLVLTVQAPAAQVTSYTLINADTDLPIRTINSGDIISLSGLPTHNLNIRANVNSAPIGSVVLKLTGAYSQTRIEEQAPYALFGNVNSDYRAWTPVVGSYNLVSTPYSGSTGTGAAGSSLTISFSFTK